jgi:hypothetical protein
MKDQATRMTSTPPDLPEPEPEKERNIEARAFEIDRPLAGQHVPSETGTGRPRPTTEGLFLIAPPRS